MCFQMGKVHICKMLSVCLVILVYLHPTIQDSHSLDELLKERQYDRRIRPFRKEKVLHVKNQIFVLKLTKINEHDFTYEISYFIRQWWTDPRLASNDTTRTITYHQPPDDLIWLPDLTLINSDKNEKVKGNVATHIDYKGNVFTSQRMKATCSCIMDLAFYPMDTQHCPFKLESYAYSTKDVRLEWEDKAVDLEENLQLSSYSLVKIISERTQKTYTIGNASVSHDNLILKFVVKRTFLYYLYRAYIPIMLLMVFNIGSYFVPDTSLPARVTLIVTTFLTNTFILQSVSEQTVRVSTTTSLQVFIVANIVFIVVAVIEYLIVLHLRNKEKMKTPLTPQPSPREPHLKNGIHLTAFNSPAEQTSSICEINPPAEIPKKESIHRLDMIFRIASPIVYLVFCCIYFGYYLGQDG